MKQDILPIGSIVVVNGVDFMICAYIKKGKKINNESYDYVCCEYPIGVQEKAGLIKKEDIARIKFIGYQDNRFVQLKEELRGKDE